MKFSSIKILLLTVLTTLVFTNCNRSNYEFNYETIINQIPVNLESLNSSFDDYNSDLPYLSSDFSGICFSTNRNNNGNNFDIIYKHLSTTYHERDDVVDFSFSPYNINNDIFKILDETRSEADELGPYSFSGSTIYKYFLYANNTSGNFDIQYVSINKRDSENFNNPKSLTSINSQYDDLYPSIVNNQIYFCSNRQNNVFNIYSSIFDEDEINPDIEKTSNPTINLNNILSSNKDDKCPHVLNDIMLFSSNREGGFGGYDLYYSRKINDSWSEPVNFGNKINSEFDEYRPIFVPFSEFTSENNESVLIFSSNRTGGKGGFDLYSARVDL